MTPILSNSELAAERAVRERTGETLPARNARLKAERIAEKVQARERIAGLISATSSTRAATC